MKTNLTTPLCRIPNQEYNPRIFSSFSSLLEEIKTDQRQETLNLQNCVADFAEYDKVYREFLTAPFPVRTTVGSDLIGILVEIDFVVAL